MDALFSVLILHFEVGMFLQKYVIFHVDLRNWYIPPIILLGFDILHLVLITKRSKFNFDLFATLQDTTVVYFKCLILSNFWMSQVNHPVYRENELLNKSSFCFFVCTMLNCWNMKFIFVMTKLRNQFYLICTDGISQDLNWCMFLIQMKMDL